MTKDDNDDFENSTKYWICDNDYNHGDVKVRDHCHITEKYRDSVHRDLNINFLKKSQSYCCFSQPKKLCFSNHILLGSLVSKGSIF